MKKPHRKKLVYLPADDIDVYDYESDVENNNNFVDKERDGMAMVREERVILPDLRILLFCLFACSAFG